MKVRLGQSLFLLSRLERAPYAEPVAEMLCPRDHPYGTKRPPIDTDYYQTFNRDNVTLVDVRGRNGLRLADKWAEGPRTYLGAGYEGFAFA